jgi:O-antigen/teichoic acid export membrane protein
LVYSPSVNIFQPEILLSLHPAKILVIKNTLYIFAGRFFNAVFVFLLILVVSRQLGPALFGVYSFLTTVVLAANCFSNLGFDTWMVREVTKNPSQGKSYITNILGFKTPYELCFKKKTLLTVALHT